MTTISIQGLKSAGLIHDNGLLVISPSIGGRGDDGGGRPLIIKTLLWGIRDFLFLGGEFSHPSPKKPIATKACG